MPLLLLLILFIGVPIAEISVLIKVGGAIGAGKTIVFVILTAVLGAYLVRQQGMETVKKMQQESQAGRVPAMQVAEGVALLFAGAVLMTPGFLTDALGFALLIPPIRQALIVWAGKNMFKGQIHTSYAGADINPRQNVDHGSVIEGEYTSQDDQHK